jgi:phospholipid/cholesterol/gamma-HCH transport system permease protein
VNGAGPGRDPRTPTGLDRFVDRLLVWPLSLLGGIGDLALLAGQVCYWTFRPPLRPLVFLEAFYFVGVGSIFIVLLVASFMGGVISLQTISGFADFGAENMVGGVIGLSFTRELAPVFTALMLTARAGAAMATELGTMRVTDQIDALKTMGISPIQYLVAPRVVACTAMAPLLCYLFNIIGMVGAYFVAVGMMHLDPGVFVNDLVNVVDPEDLFGGLIKATVLGFVVSLIACRKGFYASGGAAGVGTATTQAVVHGFVSIFIFDYFLTELIQQ